MSSVQHPTGEYNLKKVTIMLRDNLNLPPQEGSEHSLRETRITASGVNRVGTGRANAGA